MDLAPLAAIIVGVAFVALNIWLRTQPGRGGGPPSDPRIPSDPDIRDDIDLTRR